MRGEAYSQAVDDLDKVIAVGGQNPFVPQAYFLCGSSTCAFPPFVVDYRRTTQLTAR